MPRERSQESQSVHKKHHVAFFETRKARRVDGWLFGGCISRKKYHGRVVKVSLLRWCLVLGFLAMTGSSQNDGMSAGSRRVVECSDCGPRCVCVCVCVCVHMLLWRSG
jgi:hypothetical protein